MVKSQSFRKVDDKLFVLFVNPKKYDIFFFFTNLIESILIWSIFYIVGRYKNKIHIIFIPL